MKGKIPRIMIFITYPKKYEKILPNIGWKKFAELYVKGSTYN